MYTHRVIRPYFLAAQSLALIGWLLGFWHWSLPVCSMALYLALLAYGSLTPQAGSFVYHRSSGTPGQLALTYDDGPVPGRTDAILDLLRDAGVKATFFCIGERVERSPILARRIVQEGHTIGAHTMTHPWWWGFLHKQEALCEITDCVDAIQRATGVTPTLFRPPFGVTNPSIAWAINRSGLEPIAWDLRTFDSVSGSGKYGQGRIMRKLDKATIVLMHDPVPAAIPFTKAILDQVRRNGTTLVPL